MRTAFLLGSLALGLGSCAVTVRSNVSLTGGSGNLIADLRPDRGAGASYRVGEAVRFRFTARTAGYVTLVALQPNGFASTLIQNAYVPAGTTVFPRAQDAVTYNVAPPTGLQRVRAIFTRVRPTTDLILSGVYDGTRWNTVTTQYVQPYAAADRDVQETYLYIR